MSLVALNSSFPAAPVIWRTLVIPVVLFTLSRWMLNLDGMKLLFAKATKEN